MAQVDVILTDLAQNAIVLVPGAGAPAPNAGDQFLWDLLVARPDMILVTGDKRLLNDPSMRGRVIAPREFTTAP